MTDAYDDSIFINCPFDTKYANIFEAIVFTSYHCGFKPRCAFEEDDASEIRLEKLYKLISKCKYGIHDISRTDLDSINKLPRFNMPLELGIFLGTKKFGNRIQKQKQCLIFDSEAHRYQKFISDIAGQDVKHHNSDVDTVIRKIRDWLKTTSHRTNIPGHVLITKNFKDFKKGLPIVCNDLNLDHKNINYIDLTKIMIEFIINATNNPNNV